MASPERNQAQDEQRILIPKDIDFDSFLTLLVDAGIPVDLYGIGDAKTVHHLLSEVADGESLMAVDSSGNLHRELSVLWVDVINIRPNGDIYLLKEDRQEFHGRLKPKRRKLQSSIGEKLKPGEDPVTAVKRALEEELGIKQEITSLHHLGDEQKDHTPETYPGLTSSYNFYKYAAVIPDEAFVVQGYIERQVDKTNYYVWELVHSANGLSK